MLIFFNFNYYGESSELDADLIEAVESQAGFIEGGGIYFTVEEHEMTSGDNAAFVYGMDSVLLSSQNILEDSVDTSKLMKNGYIIEGIQLDDNGNVEHESIHYDVGDKVQLKIWNSNHDSFELRDYEVLAHIYMDSTNTSRWYAEHGEYFYMPTESYRELVGEPNLMAYLFNVNDSARIDFEEVLNEYSSREFVDIDYETKDKFINDFNDMQRMIKTIGITLSIIVGMIGFLNFTNVIVTSIITRRREFATLQCVGMTGSQLKTMLLFEGLYLIIGTLILAVVLGIIVSFTVLKPLCDIIWFTSYKFIIWPLLYSIPIYVVIGIMIPVLGFKISQNKSLVDKLRY